MLECLHGSEGFIDDICCRLKGHRKYKYIWKSLPRAQEVFPARVWLHVQSVCPPAHIPAPAVHVTSSS